MKRMLPALAALAALAAPALANDLPQLSEEEWWQKEGFGFGQAFYTQYKIEDAGKPLQGGGFAFGGEYVNQEAHFGIGATFTCSFVMQDYTGYKVNDNLLGLDLYIPFRLANELTVYVGGGGTAHGFDLEFDKGYGWNNGRSENLTGSGEEWENDGVATTANAFIGFRWRFFEHVYLFGEYRREFGKIDVELTNYVYSGDGSHPKDEFDMSGNRFLVGLGCLF